MIALVVFTVVSIFLSLITFPKFTQSSCVDLLAIKVHLLIFLLDLFSETTSAQVILVYCEYFSILLLTDFGLMRVAVVQFRAQVREGELSQH